MSATPTPLLTPTDIESTTRPETPTPVPTPPPVAHTQSSSRSPSPVTNAVDDFFGARPTSTHESRHDSPRISLPPPYASSDSDVEAGTDLPAYSVKPDEEPATLAQYLFKFGFLFPPFFIFGALILLSPLSAPSDWHAEKPESDRQHLVKVMRKAEVKWARRCLWAVIVLAVLGGLIALAAWAVVRR